MPTDRFTHAVDVAVPPKQVWGALQQASTWQGIGPIDEVWDATHDPDATLSSYRWSARAAGTRWEGTAKRVSLDPGRSMSLVLESSEIAGTIQVAVEGGDSSRLTVTMEASPRGMLANMFWGVVSDAIRSGIATQVEAFARRLAEA